MAGGWTRDGGVQDQINASVKDAVKLARSRLSSGEGSTHCEECESVIPEARRKAIPGVRLCVSCQSEREALHTTPTGFNRRGSKDSQLKLPVTWEMHRICPSQIMFRSPGIFFLPEIIEHRTPNCR